MDRVVGWEAGGQRMAGQIVDPQRLGVIDQDTQDAVSGRQWADPGALRAVQPVGDELAEPVPAGPLVQHTQRAVPRVRQQGGRLDDTLQCRGRVEVRGDGPDRFEHGAQ